MSLIIEDVLPSIYCSFGGVKHHESHSSREFIPDMFQVLPITQSTTEQLSLLQFRQFFKNSGKKLANGTDLDFLLKNQTESQVADMLTTWEADHQNNKYIKKYLFFGTVYNSLTYKCSGDIRGFWRDIENYHQWVETPNCLDDVLHLSTYSMYHVVLIR